jgi:hypothetical protein
MKIKVGKTQKMTKSEEDFLDKVALKIKDRVLFPEKVEDAKKCLERLRNSETYLVRIL